MRIICSLFLTLTSIMTVQLEVNGNCIFEPLTFIEQGSKLIYKCVYDHLEYMVGTQFKTNDCYDCECESTGFFCCGFGIHAGNIDVPSGHKLVQYGCDYKIEKDEGANIKK